MAGINKSQHLLSDLMGVLRGVYIMHSHSSTLPTQRSVLLQRQLTNEQRQQFGQHKGVDLDFLDESQQTSQEGLSQEAAATINIFAKVQEPQLPPAQVIQPPVIEQEKLVEQIEKKVIEEFGESSFGKSQQQNTVVVDDDSTPFFMKQDRPKFSAQERYVPASSTSRAFQFILTLIIVQFGMLGMQLIGGTVKEAFKYKLGMQSDVDANKLTGIKKYAANANNADKLQKTFRKMRGAVLKLGQILSTSEDSVVPPVIRDAMEKARSNNYKADIMPVKQVVKILEKELGNEWQKKFREINLYPFAAASVGQVHEALLKNGQRVALKIQYNGVGDSIDSDLNNFKRLVTLETTRMELYWETDYKREARYQTAYGERLKPYHDEYYCPKVYDDLVTKHVLCTEFIDGVEIDTILDQPQHVRNRAGSLLLKLCFKELFEWKIMQTDPNPANFLYDLQKQRLHLLDFGSGRDFDQDFLDGYMRVIHGAVIENKEQVMESSYKLKFLTGEENKEMLNAHYAGAQAIGEPFRHTGKLYDFSNQQITKNIYEIIPAMSKHRLTPPPKEIYSLHRKIMGTYLMCIKLRAQVPAKQIFEDTYQAWKETLKTV